MIYVDEIREYPVQCIADLEARRLGNKWAHLWCDAGQEDQLHAFARKIGLRREWFQDRHDFPHYDLTPNRRRLALVNGATAMRLADWLKARIERRLSAGESPILHPCKSVFIRG